MRPTAAASTPVGTQRLANAYHAVGLAVLLAVALYFGHVVLVPVALSALFAFVLSPPAAWAERRGLGRVAGVLVVTVAACAIVGGILTVATMEVRDLAADLANSDNRQRIEHKVQPVRRLLDRVQSVKSNLKAAAPTTAPTTAPTAVPATPRPQPVVVQSPGESSLSWLPSLAGSVLESVVNGVLIVVLTLFLLMQREAFRDRLIRLAGRSRLSGTTRALQDAAGRVGKYLAMQLGINAALGVTLGVVLFLIRVPYAPLWGLLITVLRFVPYVGYWVAGAGAILISAATHDGWGQPAVVFALFAACDLTMANVVEPLVFSHGTGVSPVALLVAAVFWAMLWGPVGLLLSTPLTVCLAVLGKHVPALGFLAILLGDEPSLDMAARFYNRLLARDYDEAAVLVDTYEHDHPRAATYDDVILPALAQAKTDREQQDLSADEERTVYDATRAVLDGLGDAPRSSTDPAVERAEPVHVIGYAVYGPADELALRMLGDAIGPAGGSLEVTTPKDVTAVVGRAGGSPGRPTVVCFSTLSPGGLSQARALLGQVRRQFPDAKLLVGRWGQTGDTGQTDKYLRTSGADAVGWSLRETIGQLLPGAAGESERSPS